MVFDDRPILKSEVGDSLEVAYVVCDYGRIEAQGVGRNHGIENADWVALRFEKVPEGPELPCGILIPWNYR